MDSTHLHTDVLVIGAGPTGLMAGAWLQKFGIDARVIDAKAGPTRESRALAVQARSMEIYRQLGLDSEVLKRAVPTGELRPGIGAKSLKSIKLNRLGYAQTKYSGLTMLEQSANEEILAESLNAAGHKVLWNHSFESLEDDGKRVRVRCATQDGPMEFSARFVIAADGASSPVRESLGINFDGATDDQMFYVLDANGVSGMDSGINLRFAEDNFMLGFPMGDDGSGGERRRLLGVMREPEDAGTTSDTTLPHGTSPATKTAAGAQEAQARTILRREFGVLYTDAQWFATYRVHHRVAEAFGRGRVFLTGDAAHIHSPVGAQGMNTGLQDAHNLVCKIKDVLDGTMPEHYLQRYEAERRPVAVRLVQSTDRVFAAITANTWLARTLRTRVMPAAWPMLIRLIGRLPAGRRFFGYLSQIRIHYWMSEHAHDRAALARGFTKSRRRGNVLGRRLPWVPFRSGEYPDNFEVLNEASWQVHGYGSSAAARARELATEHAVACHLFPASPKHLLPEGSVVLVRPDMFVAHFEQVPR